MPEVELPVRVVAAQVDDDWVDVAGTETLERVVLAYGGRERYVEVGGVMIVDVEGVGVTTDSEAAEI